MKIVAVIPARYASTRFPGKPLAGICGKPMIQRVYENTRRCSLIDRVVVATDSAEIVRAVQAFGGEVCLTSDRHETGTDRIAEAAQPMEADLIVNVQGDEPLLQPQTIEQAVGPVLADARIHMGTLKTRIKAGQDMENPNIVKVVTDARGRALYFSRSAIPFLRSRAAGVALYRHIGLYVYRRDFLLHLTGLPQSGLEKAESLEQLRALENGFTIHVAETDYEPIGVDVPEDIATVENFLLQQGLAI
jgi:3-deoxy-manno-octulosonate cytidylyltransferase (CMP-KDO synthetase)